MTLSVDIEVPRELKELFESGVSLCVGTRDRSLRPEAARACGAIVHEDLRAITVFLPSGVAARSLANARDNGHIAIGFSSVLDHKTIQVKGVVSDIRPARDDEREIVIRYHAAFAEVLFLTGIPRTITRRFNAWPATAITFNVTDLFVQTPGPGAGERLKTTS